MSDVKSAKDALVASLFELSKAAQDTATATVNFYKVATHDGNADSLNHLATTLNTIASNVTGEAVDKPSTLPAVTEEKKKKKIERDPNAPKKPLTIFFAFSFHTREVIREERKKKGLPALSAIEMNDIIKERWSSITPEEKAKWQKKYANELKDYQKVKEAYKAGLAGKDTKQIKEKSESEVDEIEDEEEKEKEKEKEKEDKEKEKEKEASATTDTPKKSKEFKKRKSEKSEKKSDKKSKSK